MRWSQTPLGSRGGSPPVLGGYSGMLDHAVPFLLEQLVVLMNFNFSYLTQVYSMVKV